MNSQERSAFGTRLLSFFSSDVKKTALLLFFIASIIFFVSSHSDCWFSISCHPDFGTDPISVADGGIPAVLVGFSATLVAASVFGAPITLATGVGVLFWLALRFWL